MTNRPKAFNWKVDVSKLVKYDGKTGKEIRAMYQQNMKNLRATVDIARGSSQKMRSYVVIDDAARIRYLTIERELNFVGANLKDGEIWNTTEHFRQFASGKKLNAVG